LKERITELEQELAEFKVMFKAVVAEKDAIIKAQSEKITELEARLNQNSTNSSKPPSSDTPWNKPTATRKPSGKKKGGQIGHKGHGLKLDREPDIIVPLEAEKCSECGVELSNEESEIVNKRYEIEVKIITITTCYEQYKTTCPNCGTDNIGEFPKSIRSTQQYGSGVSALSVLMTNYAMVSFGKTSKIMRDLLGITISPGTIANMNERFAKSSETKAILAEIKTKLLLSPVLNADETGCHVDGRLYWLHTASNAEATYNTVSEKRGSEGTDKNGVLKEFNGTAVHDCLASYFKYDNCKHALCCAHLLRELTAVIENTKQKWAPQMKQLLLDMKSAVDKYKSSEKEMLSSYYRKKFAGKYAEITELGLSENPLPPVVSGKKGRQKRGKIRCLLDRFIEYQAEICRFSADFDVPFDNNQAERDIRNVKIKMKVSGGFRSDEGADNFAATSSVIGSSVKQGKSVLGVIKNVLSGIKSSIFAKKLEPT